MPELNASIRHIPLPGRLARRPISERGFPVPWFVSWINDKWDFVNVDPRKVIEAYNRKICFLCGQPLGRYACFVIGPMCSINRISAEPPAHRECAEYAVKACPFLARPATKRNDKAAIGAAENVPGVMLEHNPGAALIWISKSYKPIRAPSGGVLFDIGDPVDTAWYAEGRRATRAQIDAAIAKGLPMLASLAQAEGSEAVEELARRYAEAQELLPVE